MVEENTPNGSTVHTSTIISSNPQVAPNPNYLASIMQVALNIVVKLLRTGQGKEVWVHILLTPGHILSCVCALTYTDKNWTVYLFQIVRSTLEPNSRGYYIQKASFYKGRLTYQLLACCQLQFSHHAAELGFGLLQKYKPTSSSTISSEIAYVKQGIIDMSYPCQNTDHASFG